MYQRTLSQTIQKIDASFPVLLLTGPRQVGKTTLLQMCAQPNRGYVTLDDLEARTMAKTDPSLFLLNHPPPVIIDEIQYAPELFSAIKIWVDEHKQAGAFWLTGSQKFHLMQGITESLAGRVAIIDLLGLSAAEIQNRSQSTRPFLPTPNWIDNARRNTQSDNALRETYQQIWLGSFPTVHVDHGETRDIFYRSYIQTYIQRDVKDILNVTNTHAFYTFIMAAAARTGQLLNYAELGRDVGIDNKTVKAWLSVLETSGLIYLLQPYHNNLTKRLVKTPKLYFLDTGLCSYLTKWPTPKALSSGAMSGAILESYLLAEILKSYLHHGQEPFFYYYRDTNQNEIDLLIETGDTIHPIEFKKTATPSKTASKHFHLVAKLGKQIGHGCVLCFVPKDTPLSRTVTAVPLNYL